jgi:tRNA-specific 2-thiouridylase
MSHQKSRKIFVALSGGVDSSVAAYLLKERGFDVYAGFIRGYNVDGCQDRDAEDARLVAQHLGIPFYVFDLEKEYEERVVKYLLDGYQRGITPNPDVVCNSEIKFGLFYDEVMELGAEAVASGHYAALRKPLFGEFGLYVPKDTNKDQTYFLWGIERKKLQNIVFPLARLTKPQVRVIAKKVGIPTAEKKDSQGVCFLGKFDFADFLKRHLKLEAGDIYDTAGKKVGAHEGVHLYTIGQGHGFTNTAGKKFFVIEKDIPNNRLIVAYEGDDRLKSDMVRIANLNFLSEKFEKDFTTGQKISVYARTRYRQPLEKCFMQKEGDGAVITYPTKLKVFPAEGQSAVLYSSRGQVLGGGSITV